MKRNLFLSSMLAAGLASAQSNVIQLRVPEPPPSGSAAPNVVYFNHSTDANVGTMEFVRNEFGSMATVKGAPYSAEAVTESVQTLQDGNRITHRDSVTLARDSEGRTRRDMTMPLIPGMSASDTPKFSFLFDPTTNTSYTLNHNSRTANKTSGRGFSYQFSTTTDKPGAEAGAVRAESISKVITMQHSQAGVVSTQAVPAVRVMTSHADAKNARTEDLGKQTMEGLAVQGSRTVTTIPAGEIGNDRPIEIVSERWYSPDLQTVVMSKHSDPRSGETTYKLTNVRREEPAKSLFEVPSGYTVESNDNKIMQFKRSGPRE